MNTANDNSIKNRAYITASKYDKYYTWKESWNCRCTVLHI